jgi:hypothetical protein
MMRKLKLVAALIILSGLVVSGVMLKRAGQSPTDGSQTTVGGRQPSIGDKQIVLYGLGLS